MKPIVVTLHLQCRDDVSASVLDWMVENLIAHAKQEFGSDYDEEWTGYNASPLQTSRIHGRAALDTDAIDNDRVWRQRGAPPSSITRHDVEWKDNDTGSHTPRR